MKKRAQFVKSRIAVYNQTLIVNTKNIHHCRSGLLHRGCSWDWTQSGLVTLSRTQLYHEPLLQALGQRVIQPRLRRCPGHVRAVQWVIFCNITRESFHSMLSSFPFINRSVYNNNCIMNLLKSYHKKRSPLAHLLTYFARRLKAIITQSLHKLLFYIIQTYLKVIWKELFCGKN